MIDGEIGFINDAIPKDKSNQEIESLTNNDDIEGEIFIDEDDID